MLDNARYRNGPVSNLIIDRYLILAILRPFGTGLGALVLVFIGYSAARQLGLAATGQLDMLTAFKLIGLSTLVTLELLLPMALFFSVLAAVSALHRDGEMDALYAGGISRYRMLMPIFCLALAAALITGALSIEGRPWAYRESYRLEALATAQFDLKKMATGEFVSLAGSDYTFIADDIDLEQGLHKNVFLQHDHDDGSRSEIILAASAALPVLHPDRALTAEFYNGYSYVLDNRRQRDITLAFKRLTLHLHNEEARTDYRRKAETTWNLARSDQAKDIAEYQWRLSTPLGTLLLALLALPLGRSRPRADRFHSILIALAVFIAVFCLVSITRTAMEQGLLGTAPGLWSAYIAVAFLLLLLLQPPRWWRQ